MGGARNKLPNELGKGRQNNNPPPYIPLLSLRVNHAFSPQVTFSSSVPSRNILMLRAHWDV